MFKFKYLEFKVVDYKITIHISCQNFSIINGSVCGFCGVSMSQGGTLGGCPNVEGLWVIQG